MTSSTVGSAQRSFEAWLDYQNQVHSLSMDFTLERIRAVLERAQLLKPKGVVITVGGTNGKGSVTAMIESIARHQGLTTGLYSSPHLVDYSERIKVNGEPVAHDRLIRHFEAIDAARGQTTLTFFEFATATALSVFNEAQVDVTILEVGLGGRLDAVNVIEPDVAVVVSISLDHCEWLGSTVEDIGREKAGIFRSGKPAIFGSAARPQSIDAQAAAIGARLLAWGRDYHVVSSGSHFTVQTSAHVYPELCAPALVGQHQQHNAAAAIVALSQVVPLEREAINQGLRSVALRGRFERHDRQPTWVFDVAHNPGSVQTLVDTVSAQRGAAKVWWLCGLLADKDARAVSDGLSAAVRESDVVIAVGIDGERGRSGVELRSAWQPHLNHPMLTAANVETALEQARVQAHESDWVVVFGSFHVVGPALTWFEEMVRTGG